MVPEHGISYGERSLGKRSAQSNREGHVSPRRMGEPSDIREGAQGVDIQQPHGTRDAKSQKGVGCRFLPLGDKMDHWRAK
jgi:hypothetical protein